MKKLGRQTEIEGFTLIELLVVIAIIAILAAILFPVFAKVREKARQISCASNEKQIGLAIAQYVEDYDETMPLRAIEPPTGEYSWRYMISPYIKSTGVFQCPDNPQRLDADLSAGDNPTPGVLNFPVSYSAARYDNGSGGAFNALTPVKLAQIQDPSTVLEIVESTNGFSEFDVTGVSGQSCFENNNTDNTCFGSSTYGGSMFAGHTTFSNFLFCDGHVKAMKPLATVDAAEGGSGTANMWTVDNTAFASGDAALVTGPAGTLTFAANKYK